MSEIDDALHWRLAAHEAGHGVAGVALGRKVLQISLDRDADGSLVGGKVDFLVTRKITPANAFRECVIAHAGHCAEKMLLRRETLAKCPATYVGPESDVNQTIGLSLGYGGENPVEWWIAARDRATTILHLNFDALRRTTMDLLLGRSPDERSACLSTVKHYPSLEKPPETFTHNNAGESRKIGN